MPPDRNAKPPGDNLCGGAVPDPTVPDSSHPDPSPAVAAGGTDFKQSEQAERETQLLERILGIPRLSGTAEEIDAWARGIAKEQADGIRDLKKRDPATYAKLNKGGALTRLLKDMDAIQND